MPAVRNMTERGLLGLGEDGMLRVQPPAGATLREIKILHEDLEHEAERRRQSIDHLLRWKQEALGLLTDQQVGMIQDRLDAKKAIASFEAGEADVLMFSVGGPTEALDQPKPSLNTWLPEIVNGVVQCANCKLSWSNHTMDTRCDELALRAAYGDR